jgi:hypothetical protein
MYNYRLTTFIVLTSMFWAVEMTIAGLFWIALPQMLSSIGKHNTARASPDTDIKQEVESTTGTADTGAETPFALKSARIKKEEISDVVLETYPAATEADIEDEGDDDEAVVVEEMHGAAPSDSGIGTSMESTRRETVRRRSMKNMREE